MFYWDSRLNSRCLLTLVFAPSAASDSLVGSYGEWGEKTRERFRSVGVLSLVPDDGVPIKWDGPDPVKWDGWDGSGLIILTESLKTFLGVAEDVTAVVLFISPDNV